MTAITRWLWLIALVGVLGCGAAPPDNHDEEAEHHVPEHRPADLMQAVQELESRPIALRDSIANKAPDVETRFSELRDIVRWVPEIAGDSALKKKSWDEVHAAALNLEELLPQQAAQWSEAFKPGGPNEQRWSELVKSIKTTWEQAKVVKD